MRTTLIYYGLLLQIICVGCTQKEKLFTLLSPEDSGITFSNRITESDTLNILTFEYIYNGGGAAIGDFNKDGLQDVFFSGNQVSNRLYINKGGFKFEDVTETARLSGSGKWKTGVALVDINNDGRLDVYVCASVKDKPEERENLLFINLGNNDQGVPVFNEAAREYGVADNGHSTSAAFFDYDNDGDLDLYVLTNILEGNPNAYRKKITDGSAENTDRLYRNDWNDSLHHAYFTDVSDEAGILIEGYGLGLNITDINRDGWKDIYVTNDFISNDHLYMNNGDGTFTDKAFECFKHTSNSAMGNDVADINNDGLADMIALDMLPKNNHRKKVLMGAQNYPLYYLYDEYGYTYEYVRNTLQLNAGLPPNLKIPIFHEISLMANIAETDWSWAPLVADFDQDGYRDLIITNGFPKDVTDRDFGSFRNEAGNIASNKMLLSKIPEVKIANYAFHNNGNLTFTDVTSSWGLAQPSFSNGAAYGDLDNDGDLDVVVNNINDSAFVYRNNLVEHHNEKANYLRLLFNGSDMNRMALGAIVELSYENGKTQFYEHTPYRGYLSSIENAAHFGLGAVEKIDQIKITWPDGNIQYLKNVRANQTLTVSIHDAVHLATPQNHITTTLFREVTELRDLTFKHQEADFIDFNGQRLLLHKLSQYGPCAAVADIDGDKLDDVFIGGSSRYKGVFLRQQPSGKFVKQYLTGYDTINATYQEDMGALFFDADKDGDADLYVVSGSIENQADSKAYQDRFYINNGKGKFQLLPDVLPSVLASKSCVKASDYDQDGDLDLFVGGRVKPGSYPLPVSSYIFRNDSDKNNVRFTDVTHSVASGLIHIGLVCDALWTDYNNDGWIDLMIAGEWMPITFFKNQNGTLQKENPAGLASHIGLWNSLAAADFDGDGDIDYVAGNLGHNTLYQIAPETPLTVYAKDFDNNGSYDAIPTGFFQNEQKQLKEYPFHGRDDLIKQLVKMRKRFPLYSDFSLADISKLLTEEEINEALILKANYASTAYIENKGKGNFEMKALPVQTQVAPVFGIVAADVDADNIPDITMLGNDYGNEVTTGRQDAFNGLLLKGKGNNDFSVMSLQQSGFFVPGDAKALVQLTGAKGEQLMMATQNRSKPCLFQNLSAMKHLPLESDDSYAIINFLNGTSRKEEFYYGSSFFSQSSRMFRFGSGIKDVAIAKFNGSKRIVKP